MRKRNIDILPFNCNKWSKNSSRESRYIPSQHFDTDSEDGLMSVDSTDTRNDHRGHDKERHRRRHNPWVDSDRDSGRNVREHFTQSYCPRTNQFFVNNSDLDSN